ncbi:unnamed protein product, partial [Choristocarpus tenellus]
RQVKHVPGAEFRKFTSRTEAEAYLRGKSQAHSARSPNSFVSCIPDTRCRFLYFDGGSRGNPGVSGAGSLIADYQGQEIWR